VSRNFSGKGRKISGKMIHARYLAPASMVASPCDSNICDVAKILEDF